MKRLILLLIILIANISFSQKTYKASKTTISSDYKGEKLFHVRSGKPITGIVIERYENESIKYEGEFVESLPTGTHEKYFENGKIKEKCNYINGQLNGEYLCIEIEKYSFIKTKCYYKNGKKDGLYLEIKENGDTVQKLFYINGLLDGKAYYWEYIPSPRGQYEGDWKIARIENYKLGIKDGFQEIYRSGDWVRQRYDQDKWIEGSGWVKVLFSEGKTIPYERKDTSYSRNGEIAEIVTHYYDVDGQIIKDVLYCYKKGNISEEKIRILKDDCPSCDSYWHNKNYEWEDSIVRQWFENGNLKYEKYSDSIVNEWFENGNLKYENNLKAGYEIRKYENKQTEYEIIKEDKRILSEKRYYINGMIKYEYFKSIDGDGYEKRWNINGELDSEGYFDKRSGNDNKYWNGTFKIYDSERLVSIEKYKEGEKSGIHKYWDKNDRLIEENNYDKGIYKEYKWNYNNLLSERTSTYKQIYNKYVNSIVVQNWWYDGKKQSRSEYIYFDRKQCYEGIQKAWYKNGQIESERNYRDCTPIGIHYEYHRNGRIYKKTEYRNGEVWEMRCFNSNGDSIKCN